MSDAYHTYQDLSGGHYEKDDRLLLGPHGFRCYLQDPVDATWHRDGKPVVMELNRLHDERDILRSALVGLVGEDDPVELEKLATIINNYINLTEGENMLLAAIDALLTVCAEA